MLDGLLVGAMGDGDWWIRGQGEGFRVVGKDSSVIGGSESGLWVHGRNNITHHA